MTLINSILTTEFHRGEIHGVKYYNSVKINSVQLCGSKKIFIKQLKY